MKSFSQRIAMRFHQTGATEPFLNDHPIWMSTRAEVLPISSLETFPEEWPILFFSRSGEPIRILHQRWKVYLKLNGSIYRSNLSW
jgi:hypothetical protein